MSFYHKVKKIACVTKAEATTHKLNKLVSFPDWTNKEAILLEKLSAKNV